MVFDLGRVLIRICDGWQHACRVAGLPDAPTGELSAEAYACVHAAVCASEVGDMDLQAFARATAPHLGIGVDDVIAMSNSYLLGPYPGAPELLDELRSAGIATACLSNTNANHWRLMSDGSGPNFMPLEKLDHQFASHLVRMRKPEDRMYAHVEQQTRVEPARIVFFDDVEENIAAARRRGWNAHRIAVDSDPIEQARRHLRDHDVLLLPPRYTSFK